ncbi:hypothetical protein GJ744_001294 [Endocarpon pusillum]|uniref:Amino acid permease/ SLC12A domain-containing protein n=1 Tax=Endocarpon pusillum TaxID=364733 RepID=A0A8H7E193_9EURO|nr:hypothetical protein GJ744_001294 [Endocarpon pusillum]
MWAITLVVLSINVWCIKLLPVIELVAGICHVAFFVALLVPLVVLAQRSSPEFVFTRLINDQSGWTNPGITWCLGLLTVTWCFVGFDGAIHMSEEVRNSAVTVPRVLILTIVINGIMAFGFLLGILFCIGDVENALNTPTRFPIIEIFYQATGSKTAATVMETCIIIIAFAASFGNIASVSRLTWAFARDGGLPFSDFFSLVDPTYRIPVRAIGLVSTVIILLSLINIGSSTAFNAIISLSTVALYVSYIIPISCLVLKRFSGEKVVWGPWTLGRFGPTINVFALCYGVFICIFLPFPSQQPVTASNMNYAAPVFGFVILFGLTDWFVRGRKVYAGPRREIDLRQARELLPPGEQMISHLLSGLRKA